MLQLPSRFATVILTFAPLFCQRSWRHAEVLLLGAILAPGTRTVTRLLRITGLAQERHCVNYHRVLNRAEWSPRAGGDIRLRLLLAAVVPHGPVVLGLDATIERRCGARIAAKGIDRDPVRSSHGHFVKASGLRWLSLMLLAPIPWAGRVWALPFLTALAPSERYHQTRGRRHKKLTNWGRQLGWQARRWLPGRAMVLVTDSSFAVIEFLAALGRYNITCVTRLRLDAALYAPAPPRHQGTAAQDRPAFAKSVRGADRRHNGVAAPHHPSVVWRKRAPHRHCYRHRRMAPQWHAGRANSVGAGTRPTRSVRAAGTAVHRA